MRLRIIALATFVFVTSVVVPARAGSAAAVLSQIYGGGGNTSASYARDFVELFNPTKTAIDLSGFRVQYASVSSERWVSTSLTGSIAPYRYYLVAMAAGASGGAPLPAPDATGSTNLARSAGKVRLVESHGVVVDAVTYGAPDRSIGPPAPTDNRHSVARRRGGCADTGSDASDFEIIATKPRNHSAPYNRCDSPPTLSTIGNKAVHAGTTLTFTLSAWDPDGDALTYSAANLPRGSAFYPDGRTFSWEPQASDVGTYAGVRFAVLDGFSKDDETITIGVAPESDPGSSRTTIAITKTESEISVRGTVSPDHRGFEVAVRLLRRTPSGLELVALQRPVLDALSSYRVSFPRPAPGRYVVRARFKGDELHYGSIASLDFRC